MKWLDDLAKSNRPTNNATPSGGLAESNKLWSTEWDLNP